MLTIEYNVDNNMPLRDGNHQGCGRYLLSKGTDMKNSTPARTDSVRPSASVPFDRAAHNHRVHTTHGQSVGRKCTKAYRSWRHLTARCTSPNEPQYPNYGGRGITVCQRWRDASAFIADMGQSPAGTSIDRIDNDGHYSCGHCEECTANGWPANCRWATAKEQANNKRGSIRGYLNGIEMTVHDAADASGTSSDLIYHRMQRGMTMQEAAYAPKRGKLTPEDVREIRSLCAGGTTRQSVADRYGITKGMVGHIMSRRMWRNVE